MEEKKRQTHITISDLLNANVSIRFEMSTKYERFRGNGYFVVFASRRFYKSLARRHA